VNGLRYRRVRPFSQALAGSARSNSAVQLVSQVRLSSEKDCSHRAWLWSMGSSVGAPNSRRRSVCRGYASYFGGDREHTSCVVPGTRSAPLSAGAGYRWPGPRPQCAPRPEVICAVRPAVRSGRLRRRLKLSQCSSIQVVARRALGSSKRWPEVSFDLRPARDLKQGRLRSYLDQMTTTAKSLTSALVRRSGASISILGAARRRLCEGSR
jgi:hypothetical protein